MSFADEITNVRGTRRESEEVRGFIVERRQDINTRAEAAEEHTEAAAAAGCAPGLMATLAGGLDVVGGVLFAGVLRIRGYRCRTFFFGGVRVNTWSSRGGGTRPPLVVVCGLGSTAPDCAFRRLPYFL